MPSQSVQQSHLCLVFSTVTARLCSCHAHLAASSSWGICSTVGFLFSKGIVLVSHRFFLLQRQRKKKAFMTGPLNTKAGACFRQVKKKKKHDALCADRFLSASRVSCKVEGNPKHTESCCYWRSRKDEKSLIIYWKVKWSFTAHKTFLKLQSKTVSRHFPKQLKQTYNGSRRLSRYWLNFLFLSKLIL